MRSAERTRIPIKATAAREGHPPSKCVASAQYCRTPAIPPAANSPTPPYKSAPAFVSSTSPLLLLLPPAVNCRFALNLFCTRWSELAYFSIHKEIQDGVCCSITGCIAAVVTRSPAILPVRISSDKGARATAEHGTEWVFGQPQWDLCACKSTWKPRQLWRHSNSGDFMICGSCGGSKRMRLAATTVETRFKN